MTTPEQARAMARLCFTDNRNALWSLADQFDALTKERDEYAKASDTMAMVYKVARDTLNARMDVLEAAAKLALDALRHSSGVCGNSWGGDQCRAAIDLLEKAGVQ